MARRDVYLFRDGRCYKEEIMAEGWLRFMYETGSGRASLLSLMKRKLVSRIYGAYCRTSFSARHIKPQLARLNADMAGRKPEFSCYADFFAREQAVVFPGEPGVLGSPCQCAASAFPVMSGPVMAKGLEYSLAELLDDHGLARRFEGGLMLRLRLAPLDYHRVHFFDSGAVAGERFINGHLYSVNPIAASSIVRLYCENKRALFFQRTVNFGDVLFVEVGATMVGSIKHCFKNNDTVRRGQTAGYFMPGGSLVLIFFEPGGFMPELLIHRTELGFETKVDVGEPLL